jgi:hypothetical protein
LEAEIGELDVRTRRRAVDPRAAFRHCRCVISRAAAALLALSVSACGATSPARPAPRAAVVRATSPEVAAPPPPTGPALYLVDPNLPNFGAGYEGTLMQDGSPTTYWCSPAGVTYPLTTLLTLDGPTNVADIDFDTRVPNYATSAPRDVLIEVMVGVRTVGPPIRVGLNLDAVTSVPIHATAVTSIRVTLLSNFGGSFVALSELTVRSVPGSGLGPVPAGSPTPPLPGAVAPPPRAVPYVADPLIPTYSDAYSARMMMDDLPATYWCSPAAPATPIVTTLQLDTPTTVRGLTFNTQIPGYSDCGPHKVKLELIDAAGHVAAVARARIPEYSVTTVSFRTPTLASAVRVTLGDNHGGQYFAITELIVNPL